MNNRLTAILWFIAGDPEVADLFLKERGNLMACPYLLGWK